MTEEPPEKTAHSLDIEIDADGRVVFTDLPQDLIDLVHQLDPDALIACPTPDAKPEDSTKESSDEDDTSPSEP